MFLLIKGNVIGQMAFQRDYKGSGYCFDRGLLNIRRMASIQAEDKRLKTEDHCSNKVCH